MTRRRSASESEQGDRINSIRSHNDSPSNNTGACELDLYRLCFSFSNHFNFNSALGGTRHLPFCQMDLFSSEGSIFSARKLRSASGGDTVTNLDWLANTPNDMYSLLQDLLTIVSFCCLETSVVRGTHMLSATADRNYSEHLFLFLSPLCLPLPSTFSSAVVPVWPWIAAFPRNQKLPTQLKDCRTDGKDSNAYMSSQKGN